MKTCTKCGETKPLTEFGKQKATKDGYAYKCKSCMNEYSRHWREENRERIKQYRQENKEAIAERNKRWREENKETAREYGRQWREENREHIKQYREDYRETSLEHQRRWREENKEAIRKYQIRYHQKNKEKMLERRRQWREENKEALYEYNRRYREEKNAQQPGCVYQIVNSINGKVYVGETTRGELRWIDHLRYLRGNYHENPNLQADFNEFGEDVFEWSIIQELPKDRKLLEREETNTIQRLLAEGKELYNIVLN